MKILYLSCHDALEYDEVKLLSEIGCEVFSTGSLLFRENAYRDNLEYLDINKSLKEEWLSFKKNSTNRANQEITIPKSFVNHLDTIIVSFFQNWISLNEDSFENKNVLFRTIGQNLPAHEFSLKNYKSLVKIIRYSPMERFIPHYAGEDDIIRFYKDQNEFCKWNGQNKSIINFSRDLNSRPEFCNYSVIKEIGSSLGIKVFGDGNEICGSDAIGKISYNQLKSEMKNNRVYLHTGTKPASYTLNFIEAFMTGIPIVSVGSKLSNFMGLNLYEVSSFIKNGYNGFISDDHNEIKDYCATLLNDEKLAKEISVNARESAINLFGKETIKNQWKNALGV